MNDTTDNATDVQSRRVEVPPDPGCYHFRVFSHELSKWMSWGSIPIRVGEDEAQRMSTVLWKMPGGSDVCRIIRIPPHGEQTTPDAVTVERAVLNRWRNWLIDHECEPERSIGLHIDDILKGGV